MKTVSLTFGEHFATLSAEEKAAELDWLNRSNAARAKVPEFSDVWMQANMEVAPGVWVKEDPAANHYEIVTLRAGVLYTFRVAGFEFRRFILGADNYPERLQGLVARLTEVERVDAAGWQV